MTRTSQIRAETSALQRAKGETLTASRLVITIAELASAGDKAGALKLIGDVRTEGIYAVVIKGVPYPLGDIEKLVELAQPELLVTIAGKARLYARTYFLRTGESLPEPAED